MEHEYAFNYWRKVFTTESEGHFSKAEFDKWFLGKVPMAHFPIIDDPGDDNHFHLLIKTSFIAMLEACARGEFGR
jgi:hypothetical protein